MEYYPLVALTIILFTCVSLFLLGEITNANDKILVARGGLGGIRSTQFIPRKGQKRNLYLDLKLIADVGFVG